MAWYGEDYGNRGGFNRDWSRENQDFGYRNREMGGNFGGGNFDRGRSSRGGGQFGGGQFGGGQFGGGQFGGSGAGVNRDYGGFDRHRGGGRWNESYDRDFGDRVQEGWEGLKRGFRRTFSGDYDRNYTGGGMYDRNYFTPRGRSTGRHDRNW